MRDMIDAMIDAHAQTAAAARVTGYVPLLVLSPADAMAFQDLLLNEPTARPRLKAAGWTDEFINSCAKVYPNVMGVT